MEFKIVSLREATSVLNLILFRIQLRAVFFGTFQYSIEIQDKNAANFSNNRTFPLRYEFYNFMERKIHVFHTAIIKSYLFQIRFS